MEKREMEKVQNIHTISSTCNFYQVQVKSFIDAVFGDVKDSGQKDIYLLTVDRQIATTNSGNFIFSMLLVILNPIREHLKNT